MIQHGVLQAVAKRSTRDVLRDRRSYNRMCPHCGFEMTPTKSGETVATSLTETFDHILPLAANGSDHPENLRLICFLCNQSRAASGHCVGALACVRAVLGRQRPPVRDVYLTWRHWWTMVSRRCPAAARGSADLRTAQDRPS
jgi:hypothetical protein